MNSNFRCASTLLNGAFGALMISFLFAVSVGAEPKIDGVFFAQNHVLAPDDPLFKLVGNLEALVKVQVYSDKPVTSPLVFARLELGSQVRELPLLGPAQVPKAPKGDPLLMAHSYDDSFTTIIPKHWIKPGLKLTVELRHQDYSKLELDNYDVSSSNETEGIGVIDSLVLEDLKIGAPNRLVMTMFDIHFFGKAKGADYPEGWVDELTTKLPVSELEMRRVRNVMFDVLVMPPTGDKPAVRCASEKEYQKKRGVGFDGEQGVSLQWIRALKAAAGRHGLWRHYFVNICGVPAGGQAGGFRGVASIHRHGVLLHELGHSFGLPHWARNSSYPYKRSMYGEDQGEVAPANAGPTWAFDLRRRAFIPPTVQKDSVGGTVGDWKKDPMQGGGQGDQEKTYMYRHFSDYSVSRIRSFLENRVVYWDEESGEYAKWNQEKGAYADVIENDGVLFPLERGVDVISILVSASAATPEANIVYAPIGPYKAGLIRLFDADSPDERKSAEKFGYTESRCNLCVRVTQGGKKRTYLLPIKVNAGDDPLSGRSFQTSAVNLPARYGEVTQVDLLHAPDLLKSGITQSSKVLASWKK